MMESNCPKIDNFKSRKWYIWVNIGCIEVLPKVSLGNKKKTGCREKLLKDTDPFSAPTHGI